MYNANPLSRTLLVTALSGVLMACSTSSSIIPDRRPDYRQSRSISTLEVPPDLSAASLSDTLEAPGGGATRLSDFDYQSPMVTGSGAASTAGVLTPVQGVDLVRRDDRAWLEVDASPARVWTELRRFFVANGIELAREEPALGILETEWLENRADIADGPVRQVLSTFLDFLYSAPTRDKFRIRLEDVAGGTEVFLTHYGLQEVGRGRDNETVVWEVRPRDPELEVEMLRRLMIHLGTPEDQAEQLVAQADSPRQVRARTVDLAEGVEALLIGEPYAQAWRRVGLALDRNRLVVQQRDRSQGLYLVEYQPLEEEGDEGLLSRLAFWRDDDPPQEGERYQVRLADRGDQTLLMVYNTQGRPATSPRSRAIVNTLLEAVK